LKYLFFILIFAHRAYASSACGDIFVQEAQLHPDANAKSKIVSVVKDEFGSYYQLNISLVLPDAISVYEVLGFSNFHTKARIPHPSTMNERIRQLYPDVKIEFLALPEGTIEVGPYLRHLAKGQVPIGMKGQFYHDMVDHAVGYFLLAQTPEWNLLRKHLQMHLQKAAKGSKKSARILNKINNYFEAITPTLISEYGMGITSYEKFLQDNAVKVRRLLALDAS